MRESSRPYLAQISELVHFAIIPDTEEAQNVAVMVQELT